MVKGSHHTAETLVKMSINKMGHLGHPMTADNRRKLNEARWKFPMSEVTRNRMVQSHMGKPMLEKTREAIHRANTGHIVSDETRAKIGRANKGKPGLRGAAASSWKGGTIAEGRIIRGRGAYFAWRTAVFDRDNHTCQMCGQHSEGLNAHHVKPFADYPELRFDVNNGVTLCQQCHRKIHHLVGMPKRKHDVHVSE